MRYGFESQTTSDLIFEYYYQEDLLLLLMRFNQMSRLRINEMFNQ
jgi:hypothetical protein